MTTKNNLEILATIDKQSFKDLFDTNYTDLCSYVFKLSQNKDLSEDLVQSVFIKLWEKRNSITIHTSVKAYLFKSCHHQYLKHLRSLKGKPSRLDELKIETLYQLQLEEVEEYRREKIEAITSAIKNLSPKCREAFILHKFEHIKYSEIAEIMGISVKTVENHISKALSHLRNTVSFP